MINRPTVQVYAPHQNLGCFGVQINHPFTGEKLVYWDVYYSGKSPRLYLSLPWAKYTLGCWFIKRWRQ